MNSVMFSFKNICFLSTVGVGHFIFSKSKTKLLDMLQEWWVDFVELASKYLPEEEVKARVSSIKGRPSLPFLKMERSAFHDLTSQVTRGSLIMSPAYIGNNNLEEF